MINLVKNINEREALLKKTVKVIVNNAVYWGKTFEGSVEGIEGVFLITHAGISCLYEKCGDIDRFWNDVIQPCASVCIKRWVDIDMSIYDAEEIPGGML